MEFFCREVLPARTMPRASSACGTMKLLALLSLLVLAGPARAGLIHEWRFDETSGTLLEDSIGNQDAEIVVLADGGGHSFTGSAVRLDGGTRSQADYVRIPDAVFDGLSEVTL